MVYPVEGKRSIWRLENVVFRGRKADTQDRKNRVHRIENTEEGKRIFRRRGRKTYNPEEDSLSVRNKETSGSRKLTYADSLVSLFFWRCGRVSLLITLVK
jgi:hypothetical protein